MSRRVRLTIAAFASLLMGLVTALGVSVAVGWFGVGWGRHVYFKAKTLQRPTWVNVDRIELFGQSRYHVDGWSKGVSDSAPTFSGLIADLRSTTWEKGDPPNPRTHSLGGPDILVTMLEWGWPVRCLRGVSERHWTFPTNKTGLYTHVTQIDPITTTVWTIPYNPIPLGLMLNTAAWALPWWVVFVGAWQLRRHLRFRRGHGPHCNYSLQGLASGTKCPECGR